MLDGYSFIVTSCQKNEDFPYKGLLVVFLTSSGKYLMHVHDTNNLTIYTIGSSCNNGSIKIECGPGNMDRHLKMTIIYMDRNLTLQ